MDALLLVVSLADLSNKLTLKWPCAYRGPCRGGHSHMALTALFAVWSRGSRQTDVRAT